MTMKITIPQEAIIILHVKPFAPNGFKADLNCDPADFSIAGVLTNLRPGEASMAVLNGAYGASQNLEGAWNPTQPCRSTSVGDVIGVCGPDGWRWAMVTSFGFEDVTDQGAFTARFGGAWELAT